MIKKKLTAMIAVLLVCVMLFPTAAFAYAPDEESTPAETQTAKSVDVPETENTAEQAGMDSEILEVLKEHPKLIAMFLPTLHVTVREGSVTISIDKQEQEDPGRTGTVSTQGSNLNVRTGPSTGYDIITQLMNGTDVKVLGEKDGWYQIEIPARYGYVCGEYLRVNDIPSTQTDDGYSFDIDQATILSFLELFQGMMEPAETQPSHGLTPSGNLTHLTLVDDLGVRNGEGQQFVTLVTKNGNYFYLIIDRDEKGEETVHFLNMVDERDLFALMEDDEKAAYESQMAAEQAAKEAAEKAAAEAASQTGEFETQKPEDEPAKESKKTNLAPILIIIVLMAAAGGGWFFMQTKKKKKAESAPDPDADYTDDDEEDYGVGSDQEISDSYDDEDPYENEILNDEDSSDDSEEDV